ACTALTLYPGDVTTGSAEDARQARQFAPLINTPLSECINMVREACRADRKVLILVQARVGTQTARCGNQE
ncbi:MAG: hypothetical protein WA807_02600, partial [Steroidobacteraceae bacterium]